MSDLSTKVLRADQDPRLPAAAGGEGALRDPLEVGNGREGLSARCSSAAKLANLATVP